MLGDQRIPSSDLTTWVDSILSTDVCEDSPHFMSGLERGFATSESLAMSSTKGFIKSSQFVDQNRPGISDFVQRVPQLVTICSLHVKMLMHDQINECVKEWLT